MACYEAFVPCVEAPSQMVEGMLVARVVDLGPKLSRRQRARLREVHSVVVR